jgi:hypothetical protein
LSKASQIPIVHYEPSSLRGEPLAPRGSVVVFLAARGSSQLDAIRATATEDGPAEALLAGTDAVDDDGLRVTLAYGDKVLAEEVPVPRDGRPVRLVLPFTGGEIDSGALQLHASAEGDVIEGIAVRHDPPLSAVEHAALTLLPKDVLSVNLGVALPGGIAGGNDEERRRQEEAQRAAEEARQEQAMAQAEAQAEAAEARAEARREGGHAWESRVEIHMLDATVKSLSAFQSAASMLEIRRDLLRDRQEHA